MAYTFAFVDSIADTATVRLNLSASPWSVRANGTVLGPPPRRRSVVSTLLADGESIPAAVYGNRTLTLSLYLNADADAAATQVQLLSRELDRPFNVLRYSPSTTQHVYFRILPSDYNTVEWDAAARLASVNLLAEPFAYGTKQTAVNAATLAANPASANGNFVDIAAASVLGDVETPCDITIDSTHLLDATVKPKSVFAIRRRGTPANAPMLLQAESMTQGTNTTTQANDGNFSGAGNNYSRCTFGTATMTARLSKSPFPAAAGVDVRGTYRVFARIRQNTGGDVTKVQFSYSYGATFVVTNDAVTVPGGITVNQLVDVGLVTFPLGPDPVYDGYSNVELSVENSGVTVTLAAQRVSGAGTMDFDYLLFVPADDCMAFIDWADETTGALTCHVDGITETVWAAGSNTVFSFTPSTLAGRFVRLTPNTNQRLYFVPVIGNAATETIAYTYTVSAFYYPRYIHVRPPTT